MIRGHEAQVIRLCGPLKGFSLGDKGETWRGWSRHVTDLTGHSGCCVNRLQGLVEETDISDEAVVII